MTVVRNPTRLLHGFSGDLRLAARRLLATPLFTIFAVLSLAIGVALTTAVYSIVDSILLKDVGIGDPDRVAFVVTPYDGRLLSGSISEPDFRDLRAAQTSFSRISASALFYPALASSSTTERVTAEAVDGAYFSTLAVNAAIGRPIEPADDVSPVAVLSDGLWRTRFKADPKIIGQTIRISGRPFEVIGVAAASFEGVRGLLLGGTRLWIPLALEPSLTPLPAASPREGRRLMVFGRLAPSLTVGRASTELSAIAQNLDRSFPPPTRSGHAGQTERPWKAKLVVAIIEQDNILRRFGVALVVLVALVLVVACTNLANLVLARGTTRQRDLAVRCALGASRWRLVREQCTEGLLLAIAGGVASFVVFQSLRILMNADFDITLPMGGRSTLAIRPTLNVPALAVAVGSLLISLMVFGLEPAWQLTRSLDVRGALAAGAGVGSPRAGRQRTLLRWQVAISAGFFIIATMFVSYTIEEARHDSGVEIERLGVAVLNFQTQQWEEARVKRTLDRVLEEGRKDPAVEAMSVSTGMPFGIRTVLRLTLSMPNKGDDRYTATGIGATPSIFRTLGVPIVRGRAFDDRDHAGAAPVVVVSEFTARQIFGTIDAVGQQLVLQGRPRAPTATVIGVARDTDVRQILFDPRAFVYLPLAQHYGPLLTVVARSTGDAARAVRVLREAFARADPDLAVEAIGTGRAILTGPYPVVRAAGLAALALGALTLLLAMVGLFGIQSHMVAHRTREIGVRMSFGASAAQIERMVLKDGYRPVLEGLAVGLVIGLVGRQLVVSYLDVDVSVVDPWMLVVVPIPLILAAFCACYLPARRAAGVDPNVALRHE
ncbi:MAG: ABC transporter permease [Acidobacteriota bacterium]|nr:ABC transporter permease [Acidobacteriota bacterium]